jgi:hypothetical protein
MSQLWVKGKEGQGIGRDKRRVVIGKKVSASPFANPIIEFPFGMV